MWEGDSLARAWGPVGDPKDTSGGHPCPASSAGAVWGRLRLGQSPSRQNSGGEGTGKGVGEKQRTTVRQSGWRGWAEF